MITCSECHTNNADKAKFCKSCGKELKNIHIPFSDRHPKIPLKLAVKYDPTIYFFHTRFDYIEDPDRNEKKETYHRLVKNEKFGVLKWIRTGWFWKRDCKVLIKCQYDYIEDIGERFRAEKGGVIYYLDKETGKLLT